MGIIKHFTATTYVVHKKKVLLHFHKKLNMWLPVGGHIENNELPEEAALREIVEEAGLAVVLYNPDKQIGFSDVKQLFRPMHILLEDIGGTHKHIDFIYYAKSESNILNPQDGETVNLKWFTSDEIKDLDAAKNIKALSLEAINLLGTAN
jgi:ADP-ribose pyrophosphatase YjhB (NUDIX family)